MLTKKVIVLLLTLGINIHLNAQKINLNKIKVPAINNKSKNESKSSDPESERKKSEASNTKTDNPKSGSASTGALSAQEQEAWYIFYQNTTQECGSRVWIEGVYEDYFMSSIGNDFSKLNTFKWLCVELDKKIENDKKRSPETFKFYGNKAEQPEGMEYGGANNDDLPSKLRWTNKSVTNYYKWKVYVKKEQAGTAKSISKFVDASKERINANADLNTRIAYEYVLIGKELVSYFESVQGKNANLLDVAAKVEAQRLAIVALVKSKLTGKFHENNLQKVIAFSKKQTLGSEKENEITNELIPGNYSHIVAYAVEPLNRFGAKSTLSTGGRETLPSIFINFDGGQSGKITLNQKVYCNTTLFNTMKDKFYVEFEWFPDLATVNYKSHLEYMPILNLGLYLLKLQNGKYSFNFMFGDNIHTDIGSRGDFTIVISDEIKANLKEYLDKFWIKKLETVTFNSQYGEKDQRNIISNWEELKKYGYPEKITVERTGKVMKPWPNDKEIESFVGSGWGLFKRDDGKYEVIGLAFVQKPGEQKWKWTSIASDMDYYVFLETGNGNNFRIQPVRLGQGYEILQQNILKNGVW